MARTTKTERVTKHTRLMKLLADHPGIDRLRFGAKIVRRKQMIALLQAYLDAVDRTKSARSAWLHAVRAEDRAEKDSHDLVLRLRWAAFNLLGPTSPLLHQYGIRPDVPRKKSTATLVAQVEKMRATRKARGTMGKRQRKKR